MLLQATPRIRIWEVRRGTDDIGTRFWIVDDDQNGERVHEETNLFLAISYAAGLFADSLIAGCERGIHFDLDPDIMFEASDIAGATLDQVKAAYDEGREYRTHLR